jgi:hypothetical protein
MTSFRVVDFRRHHQFTTISSNSSKRYHEEINEKYIVCMDKFFTVPSVMALLREMGVGTVGTARRRRRWSPFNDLHDFRFNTFYHMNDKDNYLVGRWIDDAEVLFVSNIHNPEVTVDSIRRRPRETCYNRHTVRAVFREIHPNTTDCRRL